MIAPRSKLTENLEEDNQKQKRKIDIKYNKETAEGIKKIVKNGLEKCEDPNEAPLLSKE